MISFRKQSGRSDIINRTSVEARELHGFLTRGLAGLSFQLESVSSPMGIDILDKTFNLIKPLGNLETMYS